MHHGVGIDGPLSNFTVLAASNLLKVFLLFLEEVGIPRFLHDNLDSGTSISQRLINSILKLLNLGMLFVFTVYRRLMDQ